MPPDDKDPPDSEDALPSSEAVSAPELPGDAPEAEDGGPPATRAQVEAYLKGKGAQKHLRDVVAGALGRKATRDRVDDLAQEAQMTAMAGPGYAATVAGIPAWVDGIARITVREHFAAQREDASVFDPYASAETDGLPFVYEASDDDAADWRVGPWLRKQLKDPRERETYELLCEKARTKKSYAELAAARGLTPDVVSNRIYRLKEKYEPLWREHRSRRHTVMLWALTLAITAGILAVAVWWTLRPEIGPVPPQDFVPRPAPSASASAPPPEPFMPADPPIPTIDDVGPKDLRK